MGEKYWPNKDDEVEVVLRGRVTYTFDNSVFRVGDLHSVVESTIAASGNHVISVKRARPPLPTAPGSIVRVADGTHYILGYDHLWRGPRARGIRPVILSGYEFKVVHDAGCDFHCMVEEG